MTLCGISLVRTKAIDSPIQSQLGFHFHYADLDHLKLDQVITDCSQGVNSLTFVARTELSAGLDDLSIFLILHVDEPLKLVDYIQNTCRTDLDRLHPG